MIILCVKDLKVIVHVVFYMLYIDNYISFRIKFCVCRLRNLIFCF